MIPLKTLAENILNLNRGFNLNDTYPICMRDAKRLAEAALRELKLEREISTKDKTIESFRGHVAALESGIPGEITLLHCRKCGHRTYSGVGGPLNYCVKCGAARTDPLIPIGDEDPPQKFEAEAPKKWRPWKTPEEVPLGAVIRDKENHWRFQLCGAKSIIGIGFLLFVVDDTYYAVEAFERFVMDDGSPCGVLDDQQP